MTIRVLLADESRIMLDAMRQTLQEEPQIDIVAEVSNFGSIIQMIKDTSPDVLIFDLHMAEKGDFTPAFVRSQVELVRHTVAVSFSNDAEARALCESYGVNLLLDKMRLYTELIPGVTQVRSNNTDSELGVILGRAFKRTTHIE